MRPSRLPALALLVLALVQLCAGCVYLMGESKDSVAAHAAGTHWNYGFRGDDWVGVDGTNTSWSCTTGKKQSPINIVGASTMSKGISALRTSWSYNQLVANGSNVKVYNNGHTIQVQWDAGALVSSVKVQTTGSKTAVVTDVLNMTSTKNKTVAATPLQFHFHTDSEHAVDGVYYPMEMHIVHNIPASVMPSCPSTGCYMVTGILFRLDDADKDNAILSAIWDAMPMQEGQVAALPKNTVLKLASFLPSSKPYVQYSGSLTTPPCSEGLLWHVFTKPQTLSLKQLRKYQRAVGLKECEELNTTAAANTTTDSHHRRMLRDEHKHEASTATSFVRGSYSGPFTLVDPAAAAQARARMLSEGESAAGEYNCTVRSYGFTNRNVQPLYGRKTLYYA